MSPPPTTSEADFVRAMLVALCKIPGVRVWRQNVGRILITDPVTERQRAFRAGPPEGAADISGIYRDGTRIEVEAKVFPEDRSAEQCAWAAFIEASGGLYMLAVHDPSTGYRPSAQRWAERFLQILRAHEGRKDD